MWSISKVDAEYFAGIEEALDAVAAAELEKAPIGE